MRSSRMNSLFTKNMKVPYVRKFLKRKPSKKNPDVEASENLSGKIQGTNNLEKSPEPEPIMQPLESVAMVRDENANPAIHTMMARDTDSEEDEAETFSKLEVDEESSGEHFLPHIDSDMFFNADTESAKFEDRWPPIREKREMREKSSTRSAPILAVFKSETRKEEFFEKKRALGVLKASEVGDLFKRSSQTISIRDEMTSYGKSLLKEARKVQEELNFKYVWPGRDGKILIKRSDGSRIEKVSSKLDLQSVIESKNKRTLNFSNNSSFMMSSPKRLQQNN
ncbi:uncharacterized protein LOC129753124 [Uranotaenia lowii]|uniref:uncharacterized protein LOC129753124 n=1 Tax=Uranotaenia lowii TaxID=190385 RepID=UPI002479E4F0|nr:uncharacterized protein LOC129753124 [Uranotaenia lowii]